MTDFRPVKQVLDELEADPLKVMDKYRRNPREFCRDILRMEPLEWQTEWMQAVSNARHNIPNSPDGEVRMRFAIKSGTGVGKALRHGEPVLTPKGWKPIEKIKCGDLAIAPDGSWTKIIGVYPQGKVEIYRVEFDDGCFVDVCGDHLWSVNKWSKRKHGKFEYEVLTTREMVGNEVIRHKNQSPRLNYMIPQHGAVNFEPRKVQADPYTVGLFLGDGSANKGTIWTDDEEIFDYVPYKYHKLNEKFGYRVRGLTAKLNKIGILKCRAHEKYVPDEYKYNTVGVRLNVLQGLMDTDGTIATKNKNISFCSVSKQLAEDVAFLVRSLGGKVSAIREKKTFYNDKNGAKKKGRLAYNVNISMPDQYNPFKLKRKASAVSKKGDDLSKQRYIRRYIKSIIPICKDYATCIQVDHPSHLFLTKDFIVTHNTGGVAGIILWHLGCFPDSKIPCTAPTSPQIKAVLWPELRKWVFNIPKALREHFPYEVQTDSVKFLENMAVARTARDEAPEAFQGFHCLSEDTTILTNRGWLGLDQITPDDMVLSVPVDGDTAEWMAIDKIHSYDFDGKINHFQNKFVDMMFTDGHRFVNRQLHEKSWNIRAYNEIHQKNFFLRRGSYWRGETPTLPECFKKAGFDLLQFIEFVGWWLSEGGVRPHSNKKEIYEVLVYQTKHKECEYLKERFPMLKYYKDFFYMSNKSIARWLLKNCGESMTEKKIPEVIKNAQPFYLQILIDALWLGDGSKYPDGSNRDYYSTSRKLIDDVQEVLIKLGKTANVSINRKAGLISNSGIETKNTCYRIADIKKDVTTFVRKPKVKKVSYKGKVWCISTKYETFYAKRNEKVFLSGNSKNIMLVADEASGVGDAIFLAGQGVMSSKGAITILIGNPTRPNGWFYDAFNSDSHLYWTRTVTCLDSHLVQPKYVDDMRNKHGENSYEFKVRVMGEFHLEDSGFIIPRSYILEATKRDIAPETDYIIWGIDVSAGRNDKSAIAKRKGNTLLEPVKAWGGKNVMQFVGITVEEYYNTPEKQRPNEMCIDVIGVGHGFVARIKEELQQEIQSKVLKIRAVNVAERKAVHDRYVSKRVELWAKGRAWFEDQTSVIPYDEEFINQLASVEWEINDSSGKWQIIDKKASGKSPDKADAFILTFAGRKGMLNYVSNLRQNRFADPNKNLYGITSASYINS